MIRLIDLLLAITALLILSPLLIIIALALTVTGEKKVLYRQPRIGVGGHQFEMLKFATMLENSPTLGGLLTDTNDPRVLPVGKFLRASKLNELPQLFNVLRGELSLVGPRPQVQRHFDCYSAPVRDLITRVRPGITGVAALVFRDEQRLLTSGEKDNQQLYDELIAPYKGELEAWYVLNRSVSLYFKVLVLTGIAVVFPRQAIHSRWLSDIPAPPDDLVALL